MSSVPHNDSSALSASETDGASASDARLSDPLLASVLQALAPAIDTPHHSPPELESHEDAIPPPPLDLRAIVPARSRHLSGWLLGLFAGVLFALWLILPVRYTLGSQLRFAFAEDSLPWLRTLDVRRNLGEAPRLDAAAARLPDDYLLQVGRATALVESGGVRTPAPTTIIGHEPLPDVNDNTLVRLTKVARNFWFQPGAQAHLVRYLMVDRVRIQRAELETRPSPSLQKVSAVPGKIGPPGNGFPASSSDMPPRSIPARYTDIKLTLWALRNGERADVDNAFWPAMQATALFAACRDQEALAALARATHKSRWDAYIYEEVLGQWRLYSLAYGDHGASQQIGPLSLIAFPHLRELRRLAEMARWEADHAAQEGRFQDAIVIRRNTATLGRIIRDTATWAYEALYGTDLLLIATSDRDSRGAQSAIRTVAEWEQQAGHFLAFLEQQGKRSEISFLHSEVEESCKLRQQVDVARADASYPGIPPGIPLFSLFGFWMTGVCLLQQMLLLTLLTAVLVTWRELSPLKGKWQRLVGITGGGLLVGAVAGSGVFLFGSLPSSRLAVLFYASTLFLFMRITNVLQRRMMRHALPPEGSNNGDTAQMECVAARWSGGTSVRLWVLTVLPCLVVLWQFHSFLSGLHPVALLLNSLMGGERQPLARDALQVGFLAGALPLTLVLTLCLWALWRRVPVLAAVLYGTQRLFAPAMLGMGLVYLALLSQTLRLDAEASHAINEAARDDLHWVLTHSEGAAPENSH